MYLGIDFGTSFSQISTMYLNQPFQLHRPNEYGIPSEFYYDRDIDILVGQDALDAGQGIAAANLVSEVKMKLGNSFTLDGRTFSSKEIVREIYKMLLGRATQIASARGIDTQIKGVVISVPAEFTMQERDLIREAAETCLPGTKLPINAIIKEPVAAALAYFHTEFTPNRNILVYDLGGGTCDVALVRSDGSLSEHYDVVGSSMVRRGGRDWDKALADHISQIVESRTGIRIKGNVGFEEKVRRAAIDVKHSLSDRYTERAIARIELNGRITSVPVTRKIFDEVTSGLLRETMQCLTEVYDRYSGQYPINDIICVGGSSNMLQVAEGIRKQFPNCNVRVYYPEFAVVNGAAIYADMLQGKTPLTIGGQTSHLTDTCPFSYGIQAVENVMVDPNYYIICNLVIKGDKLPVAEDKVFYPIRDNQQSINFPVYESSYEQDTFPAANSEKRYIGQVMLTLPPNSTTNTQVTCRMKLNEQGLMEVSAREPSGKHVEAQFKLNKL